jgi:hypothetical protein
MAVRNATDCLLIERAKSIEAHQKAQRAVGPDNTVN